MGSGWGSGARMVLGVVVALAVLLPAQGVAAQEEETERVPTIFEGLVGPYLMVVQAIPNPPTQGLLNLNASAQDPETGEYLDDVLVRVFAQRGESAERARATLRNSAAMPTSYGTQINLLEEGEWAFTFEVSGTLGEGSVKVLLEVVKQPRSVAGWLAWAGMALALLLVLALAWRNSNRLRRSREG